ncbi:protein KRI1 homolog, partial [Melospiza melodia melodia]|uniref:protein KRI1 homolog n=1 Tax=Melospiza melodia melodia TaxID=1914991 RepID=UPI002FD5DA97
MGAGRGGASLRREGRGVRVTWRRIRKWRAVTWAGMAELRVNAAFAERYGRYRRREELQRLRDRYGDSGDSGDSSSSESSGDDVALDPREEREFYRTLALLKTRDPRIYRQDTAFYTGTGPDEDDEDEDDDDDDDDDGDEERARPMFLKDYERKVVLEHEGKYVDEEDEEDEEAAAKRRKVRGNGLTPPPKIPGTSSPKSHFPPSNLFLATKSLFPPQNPALPQNSHFFLLQNP